MIKAEEAHAITLEVKLGELHEVMGIVTMVLDTTITQGITDAAQDGEYKTSFHMGTIAKIRKVKTRHYDFFVAAVDKELGDAGYETSFSDTNILEVRWD